MCRAREIGDLYKHVKLLKVFVTPYTENFVKKLKYMDYLFIPKCLFISLKNWLEMMVSKQLGLLGEKVRIPFKAWKFKFRFNVLDTR